MSTLYVALGIVAVVGGGVWLVWYFGRDAREIERKLGKVLGEKQELEREILRLRGALLMQGNMVRELGAPDPTPGVFADALRRDPAAAGFSDD